tara:strand:+ start:27 stop:461 length:435 start_codon:yes stop_codon:yes gene_type:complete
MNGLIVLLIILLGALIINQIITNINNLSNIEGFTKTSKKLWKKACKEKNTKKMKKGEIKANEKYKKLEGKYNDLVEEATKKNKKAMKLQHSIKEAEVDTENDIRTADHKMKQEEKKTSAAANAFTKVKYKKDIGTLSGTKNRDY